MLMKSLCLPLLSPLGQPGTLPVMDLRQSIPLPELHLPGSRAKQANVPSPQ